MSQKYEKELKIKIVSIDEAEDKNLPSHLFPGCGNDYADFEVIADWDVSKEELKLRLEKTFFDIFLRGYNPKTKKGSLMGLDMEAPEKGIHSLDPCFSSL